MSGPIGTDELAEIIEDPAAAPFILDVREPEEFDRWQIEGKADLETVNIPYWEAITEDDRVRDLVPDDKPVIVVCAHGDTSDLVIEVVDRDNMRNLSGGMDAWSVTLVPRTVYDDGTHFVIQVDRVAKACLSYVVGARNQKMAIVDPAADAKYYLMLAERMGADITDIFDTHLHADHISLANELRDLTGATYHISEGDAFDAAFEYVPLVDGEEFRFGDMAMVVRSVATPGHTPGSTSLEVDGKFLLTGDAVFVSGVGRPDLGGQTVPWAKDLFATIRNKLSPLDPNLEVLPAHYTSRLESQDDGTLRRRLGDLLENDPVVSMTDEDEFVSYVQLEIANFLVPDEESDEK